MLFGTVCGSGSASGREPGSGRTACATCEHSETTGPTARCCAVAGAPIRIFYAGSRNGSFLGFNKNFGSRRHPTARFLRFVRNRVGSRLALTNFSVKTEKISGKFVGGGIFFIYLRREMFVEALIPGVLNGGFYRLFGHFPSRRKDAARWIGVHKYLISSI